VTWPGGVAVLFAGSGSEVLISRYATNLSMRLYLIFFSTL